MRERMQTLEEKLDPAVFFRIHRSAIVRLDRIDTLLARRRRRLRRAPQGRHGAECEPARREELEEKVGLGRELTRHRESRPSSGFATFSPERRGLRLKPLAQNRSLSATAGGVSARGGSA